MSPVSSAQVKEGSSYWQQELIIRWLCGKSENDILFIYFYNKIVSLIFNCHPKKCFVLGFFKRMSSSIDGALERKGAVILRRPQIVTSLSSDGTCRTRGCCTSSISGIIRHIQYVCSRQSSESELNQKWETFRHWVSQTGWLNSVNSWGSTKPLRCRRTACQRSWKVRRAVLSLVGENVPSDGDSIFFPRFNLQPFTEKYIHVKLATRKLLENTSCSDWLVLKWSNVRNARLGRSWTEP